MDEHILAAVFRLDESVTLLGVEKLNCSNLHDLPFIGQAFAERTMRQHKRSMFRREVVSGAGCPARDR
jgi:hypothetical protein